MMHEFDFYGWLLPLIRRRIAYWGAEEEFMETVGKLDPEDEQWLPEVEWAAFKILQARRSMSSETAQMRYGRSLADLELEEIELTCSPEAMLEEWAEVIAGLRSVEPGRRAELMRKAKEEAKEWARSRMTPGALCHLASAVCERLSEIKINEEDEK